MPQNRSSVGRTSSCVGVTNEYSATWFDTYLSPGNAAEVDRELEFIQQHLPVGQFPKILDVPCGIGRHAAPLASAGYEVWGVDRSTAALEVARRSSPPTVRYLPLDMHDIAALDERFDAVICLWTSFGFGDATETRALLSSMGDCVRPGGRILLDVYNADGIEQLPVESVDERGDRTVSTLRSVEAGKFRVEIRYSDSSDIDIMEWSVYTPTELEQMAAAVGLTSVLACVWFDEARPPAPEHPRMQFLFERPE